MLLNVNTVSKSVSENALFKKALPYSPHADPGCSCQISLYWLKVHLKPFSKHLKTSRSWKFLFGHVRVTSPMWLREQQVVVHVQPPFMTPHTTIHVLTVPHTMLHAPNCVNV